MDEQRLFWSGEFGNEYTERNDQDLDLLYQENYGITRSQMNQDFLSHLPRDLKILEIGCNRGLQLEKLQSLGFHNLWGIELNTHAIQIARKKFMNVLQAAAQDIPFKTGFFDLVFTSGVLIHIHPQQLPFVVKEMDRVTNRYLWGFEYFSLTPTEIPYRNNSERMWKMDFANFICEQCPKLQTQKEQHYPYLQNQNIDTMYLLEKA